MHKAGHLEAPALGLKARPLRSKKWSPHPRLLSPDLELPLLSVLNPYSCHERALISVAKGLAGGQPPVSVCRCVSACVDQRKGCRSRSPVLVPCMPSGRACSSGSPATNTIAPHHGGTPDSDACTTTTASTATASTATAAAAPHRIRLPEGGGAPGIFVITSPLVSTPPVDAAALRLARRRAASHPPRATPPRRATACSSAGPC